MPDALRKKLLWRATHRGIKEMDIVVGGYATRNLAAMNPEDLDQFEKILDIPDQDLLAWATRQEAVPPELDSAMLQAILWGNLQ